MSFSSARAALEGRFGSQWTGTTADRIRWDNVQFQQPTSGSWVGFAIRDGDGRQASIGNQPVDRYIGVILIDIFVPENTGTDTARQLADSAAAIFRNVDIVPTGGGVIHCQVPTVSRVGVRDGWYQLSLTIPFFRDKID